MRGRLKAGLGVAALFGAAVAASGGVAQAAVPPCPPAWTPLPQPLPIPAGFDAGSGYNGISAVSPTDIWAAGNANASAGDPFTEAILAHWNGTTWTLTVPPHPAGEMQFDQLFSVAALPGGMAWAVGNSDAPSNGGAIIDALSGGSWTESAGPALPFGTGSQPNASFAVVTARSASDVWVNATFSPPSSGSGNVYAHWNGSGWTLSKPIGEPEGADINIRAMAAISASNVWAVGTAFYPGDHWDTLIEHWNGTRWSVIPTPQPSVFNELTSIDVVTATNIFVAGNSEDNSPGPDPNEATSLHWNGSSWSQLAGPRTPTGADINALTGTNGRDIWMLGDSGAGNAYYAHYDGTRWIQLAPPAITNGTNKIINAATQTQGQLWATSLDPDPPMAQRLCPDQLSDAGFAPQAATVPVGSSPDWQAPKSNTMAHRIADASPLGLFTAEPIQPGFSQTPYRFAYASSYSLKDPAMPAHTMTLGVVPVTDATSFPRANGVQVVWAAAAVPDGYVMDVQVKKPGSSSFTAWKTGVNNRSARYATATAGSYQFRARLRQTSPAPAVTLGWSPAVAVTAH